MIIKGTGMEGMMRRKKGRREGTYIRVCVCMCMYSTHVYIYIYMYIYVYYRVYVTSNSSLQ